MTHSDDADQLKMSRVDLDVIVGTFLGEEAMRVRSLRSPTAIVISTESAMIAHNGILLKLRSRIQRLLVALVALRGKPLSHEDAFVLLWGDDPDGGPDDPTNSVSTMMVAVRTAAAALGYHIENTWGEGWRALRAVSTPIVERAEIAA